MSIQLHRTTREDDEWLISVVRLRRHHSSTQIGKHLGLPSARIRTLCNRVLMDDLKLSGEAEANVRASYWSDKA